MLVLTPLQATPDPAATVSVHDHAAVVMMAGHAAHDMPMGDCCPTPHGHDATADCHCVATCASVLPVLAMPELARMDRHTPAMPCHAVMAPGVVRSPPLRPPLLQTSRLA